jgi:hypothetical protein
MALLELRLLTLATAARTILYRWGGKSHQFKLVGQVVVMLVEIPFGKLT